jgi:hypothetical protein
MFPRPILGLYLSRYKLPVRYFIQYSIMRARSDLTVRDAIFCFILPLVGSQEPGSLIGLKGLQPKYMSLHSVRKGFGSMLAYLIYRWWCDGN